MKKTIKISTILLLLVLTGSTALSAKAITNNHTASELLSPVNDKEKDKNKKEVEEKKDEAIAGEPFFRATEDLVSVNLLNLDGNPVHVQVLDATNRVLFKEVIKGEHSVGKRFDFSQAEEGVYTIVVKDCERKFYKKVEKE